MRDRLEAHQVAIYLGAVAFAVVVALLVPDTAALEHAITPVLALMLFVTFLQVPLADLGQAVLHVRSVTALLGTNFVLVPLLVAILVQFAPENPLIRIGVLMVLLTPCIDYVVIFAHMGRADARLLLAATPVLLLAQMVLLPIYLWIFLGEDAAGLVRPGPFVHAFLWLIILPLMLAGLVQLGAARLRVVRPIAAGLGLLPVPATALVLFFVIAFVVPQLGPVLSEALRVVPIYVTFAVLAPLLGWFVGRLAGLDAPTGRSLAFSAGTRNSLVVLPLALAVPGAVPLLPAIIVTQTLVELVSELVYVRAIPRLGQKAGLLVQKA